MTKEEMIEHDLRTLFRLVDIHAETKQPSKSKKEKSF